MLNAALTRARHHPPRRPGDGRRGARGPAVRGVGPGELAGLPVLDPRSCARRSSRGCSNGCCRSRCCCWTPTWTSAGRSTTSRSDGVMLVPRGDDEPGVYRSGVLGAGGGRGSLRRLVGRGPTRAWTRRPPPSRSRSSATPPTASRRGTSRGATASPRARSSRAASTRASRSGSTARSRASRTTRSACWTRAGRPRTRRRVGLRHLPGGVPLDAPWAVLREAPDTLGDPFTREGAEKLLAWAAGPADRGAQWGITRYLAALWSQRPDLSRSFPDLETADGERFARWAAEHGPRKGWPARSSRARWTRRRPFGVNVAGYLSSTLGTAEAARLYMTALRAADVPMRMESLDPPRPPRSRTTAGSTPPSRPVPRTLDTPVDYAVNLVTVNAIQLPQFVRQLGEDFFAGTPTVGVWAWETSVIPASWTPRLRVGRRGLDAQHLLGRPDRAALAGPGGRRAAAGPSTPSPRASRCELDGIPDGFWFLFAFDFLSTIERKNPLGLVEAFTQRLRQRRGPAARPEGVQRRLQARAARAAALRRPRPRRHPPRRPLDARRRSAARWPRAPTATSRCTAPRASGSTMAEAMALGKPVIATGYSGNLDFMDPSTAYLVGHGLTEVGPGVDIYPADGIWAEPDLDHAAELMRRVVERPDEAAEKGARAREEILRRFSPEATGALARTRLEQLAAAPPRAPFTGTSPADAALPARRPPATLPASGAASPHPKALAKHAAKTALRPYRYHAGARRPAGRGAARAARQHRRARGHGRRPAPAHAARGVAGARARGPARRRALGRDREQLDARDPERRERVAQRLARDVHGVGQQLELADLQPAACNASCSSSTVIRLSSRNSLSMYSDHSAGRSARARCARSRPSRRRDGGSRRGTTPTGASRARSGRRATAAGTGRRRAQHPPDLAQHADRLADVLEGRPGDDDVELAVGGREPRRRRSAELQPRRELVGHALLAARGAPGRRWWARCRSRPAARAWRSGRARGR